MSVEMLLILVWLNVYCRYFTDGKLIVTLDPNELHITKGQSANMTCSWNITDARRIRVEWRKYKLHTLDENGTLLSTGLWTSPNIRNIFVLINQTRSYYIITKDAAVMILESITEEHEGLYVCKVVSEIPVLSSGQGNCNLILIKDDKTSDGSSELYWLAIICVFPVVILVGYFICKRKKRPKRRILQKNEQESLELNRPNEEYNNDADENSSSNSVTWALSTLYESFDYFAMKNKDEKTVASCDQHATCSNDSAACSDQVAACSDGAAICTD